MKLKLKYFAVLLLTFSVCSFAPAQENVQKVLIVTTSHDKLGETGYPTGVFLTEVVHPYYELIKHGYQVDITSIKGGDVPVDPYSDPFADVSIINDDFICIGFLKHPVHSQKLKNTKKLADVDLSQYVAVIFAGGNGAIFDFADDKAVIKTIETMWNAGKVVTTLCHGSSALINAKLPNGDYLVKGQEVTGFCNEEEHIVQGQIGAEYLPFYLEDELKKRGANYKRGPVFQSFAVVSGEGRLITGQQQYSGEETGRLVVEALKKQKMAKKN